MDNNFTYLKMCYYLYSINNSASKCNPSLRQQSTRPFSSYPIFLFFPRLPTSSARILLNRPLSSPVTFFRLACYFTSKAPNPLSLCNILSFIFAFFPLTFAFSSLPLFSLLLSVYIYLYFPNFLFFLVYSFCAFSL